MKGILRDKTTGDVSVINGRLAIGDIMNDITAVIVLSNAGDLKHAPTLGANLIYHINDEDASSIDLRAIKQQLTREYVRVKKVTIEDSKLKIEYEND